MGPTEIDFGGIAHVKVGVIAHQKIYVLTTLQLTGKYPAGQVKIPGITSAIPIGKAVE